MCNVGDLKHASPKGLGDGGLTMEDEINVDGQVVSAAFDDTLDMVRG